jgi:hypothetical protein
MLGASGVHGRLGKVGLLTSIKTGQYILRKETYGKSGLKQMH